jgi:hypothetical protein
VRPVRIAADNSPMTRFLTASLIVYLLVLAHGCCVAGAAGAVGAGEVGAGAGAAGAGAEGGGAAATGAAAGGWEAELAAAATLDKSQSEADQLRSIPDRIQAQVDIVMQPITDAEEVINTISTMPQRLGISASELGAMAKGSLEGGTVSVTANLGGEARAEVEALLVKIKGIGTGLKEMPQRVKVAVKNVVELGAKATGLATKIKGSAKFAFGAKGEQKKADAAMATEAMTKIKAQVQSVKATIMGLPAKATTIFTRLAASFAM